ncbi:hypothetical protein AKUA2003_04630 [Apilactobacillus kunkeei]|nr:hypothetical protein [Staphylococcus epidermidis]CAI2580192.1 hypothetical protein AKUA2003_04630 [Apilactobacillus kunkeei]CAI2580414.1 hypothetical protein AKUA1001_04650 [Apilactobacillus kunkeei]CAI2801732.1 hypothetical protein AKUA2002_04630 [Apilactobacillus kunkeei]
MLFIILIIIIIAISIWVHIHNKNKFLQADNGENILFTKVSILDKRTNELIGADNKDHIVHYMGLNKDKQVYFPTSSKPDKRYYILNVSFQPNVSQTINTKGRTGSALVGGVLFGGVGAVIGASRGRTSTVTNTEHTADCYIQVVDKDMRDSHTWVIRAKSELANELAGRYMLNDQDLNQLADKAKRIVDENKK